VLGKKSQVRLIREIHHVIASQKPNYSHEDLLEFIEDRNSQMQWYNSDILLPAQEKKIYYRQMIENLANDDFTTDIKERLKHLINLEEVSKTLAVDQYALLQYIQDSSLYFIPVFYLSWETGDIEDKYSLIARLLGQEWDYELSMAGLSDATYFIVIKFERPQLFEFTSMEIYLSVHDLVKISNDPLFKLDRQSDQEFWRYLGSKDHRVMDFIKEKPTVDTL